MLIDRPHSFLNRRFHIIVTTQVLRGSRLTVLLLLAKKNWSWVECV